MHGCVVSKLSLGVNVLGRNRQRLLDLWLEAALNDSVYWRTNHVGGLFYPCPAHDTGLRHCDVCRLVVAQAGVLIFFFSGQNMARTVIAAPIKNNPIPIRQLSGW